METCKEWFDEGLKQYGYSQVEGVVKSWTRKRLEVEDRPARVKVSPGVRRDMYAKQSGICPLCGDGMDGRNLFKLDVDHINPNLFGSAFNARANMHLCHPSCNRAKGAKSLAEVAKGNGRTVTDMLRAKEQGDDEPIADNGMADGCESERPK